MNLLVVDDEPLAQKRLQHMLEKLPQISDIYVANNGIQAINLCQEHDMDVVLLDIRMPGIDGLETAQHLTQLEKVPAIIFTTAYGEYALEAFNVHAVDYLLKPVRQEKLEASLARVCQLNSAQINAIKSDPAARTNIAAKISGNVKLIPVADILFFQADQKYVTVKYLNGETVIEDTLKELQTEFENQFIRVHRNALVAKKYINGIHKNNDGHSFVTLQDCDDMLEISRRHLSTIRKLIANL